MIYILLLQGSDGDMLYILLLQGSGGDMLYILLLQGSGGDMIYIYSYCRVVVEICYIYIYILLLQGSDGVMLRVLLLQGSNIYITYRIIRNSSNSFKIKKISSFQILSLDRYIFSFCNIKQRTKPKRPLNTKHVLHYEMSHKSRNFHQPIGTLKCNFGFYNRLGKSYFYKMSLASSRILLHGLA